MTEPKQITNQFTQASPAIASYDFEDISNKIGFTTFYLATTGDAVTPIIYHLVTESGQYSFVRETKQTNPGTTTKTFNSAVFNAPRTILGTAFTNIGTDFSLSTSGYITAQIQKWDGTTATNITSEIQKNYGASTGQQIIALELPCTQTYIKKGEQLRIIVKINVTGGAGVHVAFGHDPMNQDATNIIPSTQDVITSARFYIPFRIEI